jgi:hypothetical protein
MNMDVEPVEYVGMPATTALDEFLPAFEPPRAWKRLQARPLGLPLGVLVRPGGVGGRNPTGNQTRSAATAGKAKAQSAYAEKRLVNGRGIPNF